MLETEEFFARFNTGFKFQQWLDQMENDQWREKVTRYYNKIYAMIVSEFKEMFANMTYKVNILAIVVDDCWDCQFYIPVLARLCENNPLLELRLLPREKNMDLMEKTNGGYKAPYVMFYSEDGYLIDKWVERPTPVYELIGSIRKDIGFKDENKKQFDKEYRKLFLKNQESLYRCAIEEFTKKICRANAIQSTSPRINKKMSEKTSKLLMESKILN
ncbi:MAG: thioredoxin family protein [Candidatus Hodarchaeales archaeon]|jgi:hypothetical protein